MTVDEFFTRKYCPRSYNCAHFVAEVWRAVTGKDICGPLAGVLAGRARRYASMAELRAFRRLSAPCDPCIVLVQTPRLPAHVGIYLRKRVLHISSRKGVRFDTLESFTTGYKKVGFFVC